jgi:hypothetical protein
VLLFAGSTVAVGFTLYTVLGFVKPVGVAPLRGNTAITLVATDRRLLVYRGSTNRRRLLLAVHHDEMEDVVLHRSLVGISRGGVVTVERIGDSKLMVESPGLATIDDLARVVDVIR